MIRTISLIAFLVCFAISFVYAADQKSGAAAAQSSKITGSIEKVDLTAKTITIRPDGSKQVQEIAFSDSTEFHKDNGTVKASDLKKGDRVTIDVDSTNMITRLDLQSGTGNDQAQNQH